MSAVRGWEVERESARLGSVRAAIVTAVLGAAVLAAAGPAVAAGEPTCAPSSTALCLNGGRFRVEVAWQDFQGGSGVGQAVPLTGDTGTFWFFNSANVELVVKVLDGRPVNGHFWVFYGSLSNVAYTLTVTDTVGGGEPRVYINPAHHFGSLGDTAAFPVGAGGLRAAIAPMPAPPVVAPVARGIAARYASPLPARAAGPSSSAPVGPLAPAAPRPSASTAAASAWR